MRLTGTKAFGVRLPIIRKGDDLKEIVCKNVISAANYENIVLEDKDVIGITESIVAKSQGNFATMEQISEDIRTKFPEGEIGVVFPILSRNRFVNILKGIANAAKKVYVLLQFPTDEVGNPIMDIEMLDDIEGFLKEKPIKANRFKELTGNYKHPFTNMDYISLYESLNNNIEVYLSDDPRDILKLTKHVLVCEIHKRFITPKRLKKAGAETIYSLTDVLSEPVSGSGYNPEYGVLGSNLSTETNLKLFPRDCKKFADDVQALLFEKTGKNIEVMVYGDGAFKDPVGIWELADPVVSPGYTDGLEGTPNEIKLKFVADNVFSNLTEKEQKEALTKMIREKKENTVYSEGTTPRKFVNLLGSLCDLISGSGDKGTPVILIKGYFDDYSAE